MIVSKNNYPSDAKLVSHLFANVIINSSLKKDVMVMFESVRGKEVDNYQELMQSGYEKVKAKIIKMAEELGCNAIYNLDLKVSSLYAGTWLFIIDGDGVILG